MGNQTINSFGIYGGGGGGASGVTSVSAGTGIVCTPDPITATGSVALDNVNGLVSTFTGTNGPLGSVTAGTKVTMYDPATYPNSSVTMSQKGRVGFGISTAGTNERLGPNGVCTFDEISVSGTILTNCTSGALLLSGSGSGIFGSPNTFTFDGAGLVICNGTQQSVNFSMPAFRVGNALQTPSDSTTDYIQINNGGTASGGNTRFTSLVMTITQFSD